jgi:50S ribosomal protein L16 3-hydroxylase
MIAMLTTWTGPFTAASHSEFVANFWQKQPLLIRGFLDASSLETYCPLSKDGLIGLSCDSSGSPSRLIRESGGSRPWECRRGPFRAADFASLPDDGSQPWTLLVSGVDRALEPVEALRESPSLFSFAPRWRLDDVMVSYAPPGGSIGAHIDNYDVFLLQGLGERRWEIEARPRDAAAERLHAGLDVRVLADFSSDQASTLQPGDALYLPPRYAHCGTSTDEQCLSYSIGFRAPTDAELVRSFVEHSAASLASDALWAGDEATPPSTERRGRISPESVAHARQTVAAALEAALHDERSFEAWLGGVLTQPRRRAPGMRSEAVRALSATWAAAAPPGVEAVEEGGASEELGAVVAGELPCDGGLDGPDGVVAAIACGAPDAPALRHGETAIFAFIERADGHHALFIDGQHVSCPADASRHVPLLCSSCRLEPAALREPLQRSPGLRRLVADLIRDDALHEEL